MRNDVALSFAQTVQIESRTAVLAAALDAAPVCVFVADAEMHYRAVNTSACELLGYTEDELLHELELDGETLYVSVGYAKFVGLVHLQDDDRAVVLERLAPAVGDRLQDRQRARRRRRLLDPQERRRLPRELEVGRQLAPLGNVHVEKRVETDHVTQDVQRAVEHGAVERVPATREDSGEMETLPDGSVSIPALAEELVITKRTVVRERIVVPKELTTEVERVVADLQREHVDVDVDVREP